jgi:hypothetical protein
MTFIDLMLSLARERGYTDAELRALRRRLWWQEYVLVPALTVSLSGGLLLYLFLRAGPA